jgi:hypothetical protein
MNEQLKMKVDRAIKLIQSASNIAAANGCPQIEVAYSGGKDSDVILELTKMSGVPYRAIYKNTRYAREHIWVGEEFLLDYCDYAQEKIQDDIDKLKSSIELALREHNNEVNAQACFAVCILDVSCMAYDAICKTLKEETHCDFYESFADYYPSEAEVRMVDLARALTNDELYGTVTNKTVTTGTTIVFQRITDYDTLTSYAIDVLEDKNKNM